MALPPLLIACALLAADPAPSIVIDAAFDDWKDVEPAVVDPADAPDAFVDLGAVRVVTTSTHLFLEFEVGKAVNAQALDGMIELLLDADGRAETGEATDALAGVDLRVRLSPLPDGNPGRPGRGVDAIRPGRNGGAAEPVNPYWLDWLLAPTHAGDRFEARIDRGSLGGILRGPQARLALVARDLRGAEVDRTDAVAVALPPYARAAEPKQPDDPLARTKDTNLRVVCWNVEFSGLIERPEPTAVMLRALRPEIILIQEIKSEHTVDDVRAALNRALPMPDRSWSVLLGEGGGPLRCAVASVAPLEPIEALRLVPDPARPNRSVRLAGAAVRAGGVRLGLVSVHLACCGRIGDDRDRQRIRESAAIAEAIAGATGLDAVILGGDLNLVGSADPLSALAAATVPGTGPLRILSTPSLDGRDAITWGDVETPFGPGRLDWVLVTEGLDVRRSVAVDVHDLASRWQRRHRLTPEIQAAAADHQPIIIDVRIPDEKP